MKISVIIPILYSPSNVLYEEAVESISRAWKNRGKAAKLSRLEIILVFNNAPAGPLPRQNKKSKKRTLLTSTLNRGFTGAVNDGVWWAVFRQHADWCLVLNDDAVVDSDFFSVLIPQLKKNRAVVSCGVRNFDGSLQSAGLQYGSTGLAHPLESFSLTDLFVGTAFFVSADIIKESTERYGWLLAEFFFAYAEDLELSLRLRKQGKRVVIFPKALVSHRGSITAQRGSAFQLYWGYRNLLMVVFLHWPVKKIVFLLPWLLLGQAYVLTLLFLKGHWFVYPKIWRSLWKNKAVIQLYRRQFSAENIL